MTEDKATSIAHILETSTVHEIRETARKTPNQLAKELRRQAEHDRLFNIPQGCPFSTEGLRKLGARYSVGDHDGRDD